MSRDLTDRERPAHALLELRGVVKRYPGPGSPVEILSGVDLRLEYGEAAAVVGTSGCGKSTLLNIIGALDRPDAGSVQLDGQDILSLGDAELARLRCRRIGFIFQLHHLLPQCSVLENVLVPTLAQGPGPRREDPRPRAVRLLDRAGLAERRDYRPGELSGGERQRVAVVRALINEPALLLADEPTGSLDEASASNVAALLRELNREEGVSLLVVTHSASVAALMDRTLLLRHGRLAAAGEEESTGCEVGG